MNEGKELLKQNTPKLGGREYNPPAPKGGATKRQHSLNGVLRRSDSEEIL